MPVNAFLMGISSMTSSGSCNTFASKAKDRIVIERPVATTDAYGGSSITWETMATVWAYIEPVSHRQFYENDKLISIVGHKIIIRYRSDLAATDITAKYRVKLDGRYLAVDAVENLGNDMKSYGRDFQRLRCVENGADNG